MTMTVAMTESLKSKPVPIKMRTDEKKRNLIDMAAAMLGRDRTSFILDAACQKAEEVILDKRLFLLDDVAFDAFEQAMEANPIRGNECLRQLLERPKRWS
jgi:uncharacterized protein (DUF1778 family)